MNKEEINKKLLDDLKNLPRVDAPKDFETGLWRKINATEEEKKTGFWDKLLSPGKLAPAAIAVASAVIIFFVIDVTPEQMEDPLSIKPRLRDDFVIVETINVKQVEKVKKIVTKTEKKNELKNENQLRTENQPIDKLEKQDISNSLDKESYTNKGSEQFKLSEADSNEKIAVEKTSGLGGSTSPAQVSQGSNEISPNNLNFMQRSLSTAEKDQVQQLKMKVSTQKSAKTEENRTNPTQK